MKTIRRQRHRQRAFRHYRGQTSAQPCNVSSTAAAGSPRGVQPRDRQRDPGRGVSRPRPDVGASPACASAANALGPRSRPRVARVVAGYSSEWDGSNRAALFTDDAQEAIEEIAALCDAADLRRGAAWDAGDWLTASGNTSARRCAASSSAPTRPMMSSAPSRRVEEEARGVGEADVLTGTTAFLRRPGRG